MEQFFALIQTLINTDDDGAIVIYFNPPKILFNQRCIEMWNIPKSIVAYPNTQNIFVFMATRMKQPELFMKQVQNIHRNSLENYSGKIELKDSQLYEYRTKIQFFQNRAIGRTWYFRNLSTYLETENKLKTQIKELQSVQKDLKQDSLIDRLTQIPNRHYFEQYLAQQCHILNTADQPLSMAIFDVDYFSLFNEIYGFEEGNICLQQIANLMTLIARRPGDLVARIGGERFGVILPNTKEDGAVYVVNTIRHSIKDFKIDHIGSKISNYITVSVALTSIYPHAKTLPDSLIKTTEKTLAQAKAQGRDRLVVNDMN
jgi:diguanylate cyclase (GGDEF)-like protein